VYGRPAPCRASISWLGSSASAPFCAPTAEHRGAEGNPV
jgi:hypothetical protein